MHFSFDETQAQARTSGGGWRARAAKILTGLAAMIFLIVSVAFSLIAVAVVALVILGVGLYFWWRTRDLRRQMRAQMERATRNDGVVIDGEIIRNDRTNAPRSDAHEIRYIDSGMQ